MSLDRAKSTVWFILFSNNKNEVIYTKSYHNEGIKKGIWMPAVSLYNQNDEVEVVGI